ncbi:MAG: GumC family protein [Acidobacteriaceae bacterium]
MNEFVQTDLTTNSSDPAAYEKGEITLLDLLIVLAKHKKTIARITFGGTILALVVSFLIPKKFTATTRILPPQQTQSSALAMLSQLNPLAAGLGKDLGLKNPSDLFVTMLKSRTVEDSLINQFDLRKGYGYKTYMDTRDKLESRTRISAGKDGTIAISVEDHDAGRAAEMANAYVAELYRLAQSLAITEASQRRLFFQRQLDIAKNDLAEAEGALRQTQEKTGLIQLDGQAKAIIESIAALKAQIAARQVELQRVRLFATEQNPEYQGLVQELTGLQSQLARIQQTQSGGNGEIEIATAKIPAAGLEYVRRYRDVKYYETIFELLAKQYEAAKLDEAKNAAIIQVMDKAVPPEKKSSPKRGLITVTALFLSLLAGCLWVLGREAYEALKLDPETLARLQLLHIYLLKRDIANNV